jgi:hypothetical protein
VRRKNEKEGVKKNKHSVAIAGSYIYIVVFIRNRMLHTGIKITKISMFLYLFNKQIY